MPMTWSSCEAATHQADWIIGPYALHMATQFFPDGLRIRVSTCWMPWRCDFDIIIIAMLYDRNVDSSDLSGMALDA